MVRAGLRLFGELPHQPTFRKGRFTKSSVLFVSKPSTSAPSRTSDAADPALALASSRVPSTAGRLLEALELDRADRLEDEPGRPNDVAHRLGHEHLSGLARATTRAARLTLRP